MLGSIPKNLPSKRYVGNIAVAFEIVHGVRSVTVLDIIPLAWYDNAMKDDMEWQAEFRGLVWGEGHIGLTYYRRRTGNKEMLFRAVMKISLRADDLPMLQFLRDRLGGHIYPRRDNRDGRSPSYTWDVINRSQLILIRDILLAGILPSKKRSELLLWSEALDLMHTQGHKYSTAEKQRISQIVLSMKELRRYHAIKSGQVISA